MRSMVMMVVLSGCALPQEEFCAAQARASCEFGRRCGALSRRVDCGALPKLDCLLGRRPALEAGLVHYDPVAARRCVNDTAARACDTLRFIESCGEVVAGGSALGGSCGFCAVGTECSFDRASSSSCGSCVAARPFVGLGQDCTRGWCREGVCSALDGGMRCLQVPTFGDDCSALPCRIGAACQLATRRCVPLAELGQPCGETQCANGTACVDGKCAPRFLLGDPCGGSFECESQLCVDGICVAPSREGQPCGPRCALLLQCDAQTNTCVALPRHGEPCSPEVGCLSGFCEQGTCRDDAFVCR